MKIRVLIAVLSLAIALPAAAGFRTVQQAHEVRLSDLRLPVNAGGTIAFKACDDCPYQVKRVSETVQWVLNGKNMPLAKFRKALRSLPDRDRRYAAVLHHLEQDRVTKVSILIPESNARD